jgi:NADH-quinone oxidoreductase subunit L
MLDAIWLIPALPLAGFLLLLVFGRRLGEPLAGWLASATCAAAFGLSVAAYVQMLSRPAEDRTVITTIFSWLPVGGLRVDVGFLADPLSLAMALFVTGVSTLIHVYGIGYMHHDPKFSKFFLYLNLFVFSMLMLVLGSNLVVTFLGWEGVGVCSYFLISFWQTRPTAATAGKKAFITNRVGDVGFMLAMFLTFSTIGSLNYDVLNGAASTMATSTAIAISLLLFLGAVGKSAQLPLYLWLPDAMEGPTPVSALIHAATMVTAGVYLMVRVNPLLAQATDTLTVIAVIGAVTAFFAATIAVAQNDIKRVLAYSTISQLGYMFLAIGCGGYTAAVFLMIAHAFYKALLFLGSGSVIHGLHDEQDMRHMGALRKLLPVTAATFIVGWLAIAGIPPLAGFWAKDDVLLFAYDRSKILWAIGFVTAILTAYYMTRQVMMVFFGEARWTEARPGSAAEGHDEHPAVKPHESPWIMLGPLIVLALLSIFGGLLNLPFEGWKHLEHWLDPVVGESSRVLSRSSEDTEWWLVGETTAAAVLGLLLGYQVYLRKRLKAVEPAVLAHGWYYDKAVTAFMGGPGTEAFEATAMFDAKVVDGAVEGTGSGISAAAQRLRRFQSGYVRGYALGIGVGAVALLGWFVARGLA